MRPHFCRKFSRWNYRSLLLLLIILILFSFTYYPNNMLAQLVTINIQLEKSTNSQTTSLYKQLNIVDLQQDSKQNCTCIKTKHLLHLVQTTICLHDDRDAVSNIILKHKIWDEQYLIELFKFLIRYPQMSFIDVGANLGAYTMFAASFGRSVVSIECFQPNIEKIRKAIQIEKVQDKVVLIGNAIFNESGKYLKMKPNPYNVGSQAIIVDGDMNHSINDIYVVKTIRFDAILPVLQEKNIRNAVMKVDIQFSEVFLCETGGKVFDSVNIPVVLMEWERVPHYLHIIHMSTVLQFFIARGYVPTTDMCKNLNLIDAFRSWPGDIYWMKTNRSEIC